MGIGDKMRKKVLSWLKLTPAQRQTITIQEELDFNANAIKNATWYRGNAYELCQLYEQLENHNENFWGASSTPGLEIRKIHTGLPRLIVNTLTDIVLTDLNDFDFENEEQGKLWEQIAEENKIGRLLKRATKEALYIGDGAFKISFDTNISDLPIIEWYAGDRVDVEFKRGRLYELVFKDEYVHNGNTYLLKEHRGYGYIHYELFKGEQQVELTAIPDTAGLVDVVYDSKIILGVHYLIHESERWQGRGQSIFDGKADNLDSLDEAYSQWVQGMRASRPKTYTPESLIPRDPGTGGLIRPSAFDNQFIRVGDAMGETAKNEIKLEQPTFPSNDYLQTYITALDLCLQGLISPSTLGIDVKKLDNAEAQREKEKTTLYSRAAIIEALTPVIEELVTVTIQANDILNEREPQEVEVTVDFGEYANPSFESVVETLSNPNTPMSIEAKVDEMWGDTKDDEWKTEEVRRIKEQSGIVTLDEPAMNINLPNKEVPDSEAEDEENSDAE